MQPIASREARGAWSSCEDELLKQLWLQGLSARQIGEVLGVTESRVCQIHTKAVMGLRANLQTVS